MTPAERNELNIRVAELCGWTHGIEGDWSHPDAKYPQLTTPDYLGDARLWAPILEREVKKGWRPWWIISESGWAMAERYAPEVYTTYPTLPEAVLRLFVALEGKV